MHPISRTEFATIMSRIGIMQQAKQVGIAVSGGVDSMALCYLLNRYTRERNVGLTAFTIDHGLRPESSEEARLVGEELKIMGVSHVISRLTWPLSSSALSTDPSLPPTSSTLETHARINRYSLLASLLAAHRISILFLGHHLNDQIETSIMRLARGSGIDGLAAMNMMARIPVVKSIEAIGIRVCRPFIGVEKVRLKHTCISANVKWFEDPTNSSHKHKRNAVRSALKSFNDRCQDGNEDYKPLSTEKLAEFLFHMRTHKDAIDLQVAKILSSDCTHFDSQTGTVLLCIPESSASLKSHWFMEGYIAKRVLGNIIKWVRCSDHGPRLKDVEKIYGEIKRSVFNGTNIEFEKRREEKDSRDIINNCISMHSTHAPLHLSTVHGVTTTLFKAGQFPLHPHYPSTTQTQTILLSRQRPTTRSLLFTPVALQPLHTNLYDDRFFISLLSSYKTDLFVGAFRTEDEKQIKQWGEREWRKAKRKTRGVMCVPLIYGRVRKERSRNNANWLDNKALYAHQEHESSFSHDANVHQKDYCYSYQVLAVPSLGIGVDQEVKQKIKIWYRGDILVDLECGRNEM